MYIYIFIFLIPFYFNYIIKKPKTTEIFSNLFKITKFISDRDGICTLTNCISLYFFMLIFIK